jgi:hypothetical protein
MPSSAHPYYDPSNSKSTGQSPSGKPDRDPLTTADTLTDGLLTQPERATPAEPPRNVEPHTGPIPNVPTPTAKPATGVPEYKYKPTQHDSVPVYDPLKGDKNV